MEVHRVKTADAKATAAYLKEHFTLHPTDMADPNAFTEAEIKRRMDRRTYWIATEGGETLGVLEGVPNISVLRDGQNYSGWLYMLLEVKGLLDKPLGVEIADNLVVHSIADRINRGDVGGHIFARVKSDCPGAEYSRKFLNMVEHVTGSHSFFILPFEDIIKGPNSRGIYGNR